MKVVLISGSRNPQGQTAKAAGAFLSGVAENQGVTESYFLPTMKIERCRQCEDSGWGNCRSEGLCVIEDDFTPLVQKIKEADAAVFATPVYFSDLSESMRGFLDRLRRTCKHERGKERISGKPAVGICMAGGGGGGAPACTVSLDKILSTCGFDVIDSIPVRRQNLEKKIDILKTSGSSLI